MALLAVTQVVVYAVVPVKNLAVSKRRLSQVFTLQQRKQLTLAMLEDVLNAIKGSTVDRTVVVGENAEVQQLAGKLGCLYLKAVEAGLNAAIEQASNWCQSQGAQSILVLPADIPLLTTKEVNRIIELSKSTSAVVLSPSRNWGTNALYQKPPNQIPACFGPGSCLRHLKKAYRKSVNVTLHYSPGTRMDVDSAKDLKPLLEVSNDTACNKALRQIMLDSHKAREYYLKSKNKIEGISCVERRPGGFQHL